LFAVIKQKNIVIDILGEKVDVMQVHFWKLTKNRVKPETPMFYAFFICFSKAYIISNYLNGLYQFYFNKKAYFCYTLFVA